MTCKIVISNTPTGRTPPPPFLFLVRCVFVWLSIYLFCKKGFKHAASFLKFLSFSCFVHSARSPWQGSATIGRDLGGAEPWENISELIISTFIQSIDVSIDGSIDLLIYLSIELWSYPSIDLLICLSIYLAIRAAVYPSIDLSINLLICHRSQRATAVRQKGFERFFLCYFVFRVSFMFLLLVFGQTQQQNKNPKCIQNWT